MDTNDDNIEVGVMDLIRPDRGDLGGAGHEYAEYDLRLRMEYLGCRIVSLFIRNDYAVYKRSGREFHYMYADAVVELGKEMMDCLRVDCNTVRCMIPARYSGSDDEWVALSGLEVETVAVRYNERRDGGGAYTPTFTSAVIDGETVRLTGERLDWDRFSSEEGLDRDEDVYYCRELVDYPEDNDELLYDAYDGDIEAYWTHRT